MKLMSSKDILKIKRNEIQKNKEKCIICDSGRVC